MCIHKYTLKTGGKGGVLFSKIVCITTFSRFNTLKQLQIVVLTLKSRCTMFTNHHVHMRYSCTTINPFRCDKTDVYSFLRIRDSSYFMACRGVEEGMVVVVGGGMKIYAPNL